MSVPADQAPPAPPVPPPPGAAPFGPPPTAYAPPPGYAGPYGVHPAPAVVEPAARGSRLGLVALIAAIGAAVLVPVVAAIAAFQIGIGAAAGIALTTDTSFDWSILTPVRSWVLLVEICFWVGTGLGVWAIVQGIIAVVTNRGRALGLVAVIVAILGAIVFAAAVAITLRVALNA